MTGATERTLRSLGVVPVVQIDDPERAAALGRALIRGGLPIAEVTFRTPAAPMAIRRLKAECPTVTVGAGTVLTVAEVDVAAESGAAFVVSPGFNPAVVERSLEIGMPVVPGVNSPTQVEQALGLGLSLLKFFPAVPSGGIPMLKALHGPYPGVSFMPTGGITATDAADWLALPNAAAVGGTWIAPREAIAEGAFEAIAENARRAHEIRASLRTPSPSQA